MSSLFDSLDLSHLCQLPDLKLQCARVVVGWGGFLGLKEDRINKGQRGSVVRRKTLLQPEDKESIALVSTYLLCWSVLEQDTGF